MRKLFSAAVLLAMSACSRGWEPYPAEALQNFLAACESTGGTRSTCQCSIDRIQKKVSFKEFAEEDLRIRIGQPVSDKGVKWLSDAMVYCLSNQR